ncbi:MAG: rRNA cytosine-C5-methyltransferase, partial [Bacteroidales bacterium]|nr:rRNA cytosine-C5-methyltransferase [Bacteroidales bacterium]
MDGHALALSCMGAPASVSVRINPFKAIAPPQGASRVEWSPYGYVLESRPQFTLDPLFHAGCYYVQDSS